ncbi:hypothetical protein Tco_0162813 [Tanacetum coccineum]
MGWIDSFVSIDFEVVKGGTELEPERIKKQKIDNDQEEAEMKKHMEIVVDEEEIAVDNIDREDMETLWKLVKAKHGNTRPEEAYERVLWGDLKVMFEPDIESDNLHIFMLVEKKYPLTPATITAMLNKKLQADHWNEMCYQLLKLMTKQVKNPGSV